MQNKPLTAPFNGIHPQFDKPFSFIGRGVAVLGRAKLGPNASLDDHSVIRADGHDVRIGADFFLGHHSTVHIAHDVYPTIVGDRVTAADNVVIHACEVDDDCFIDSHTVILDGSKVGAGAVLAAGSIVYPRSELKGGWLYAGSPAKPVRELKPGELSDLHARARRSEKTAEASSRAETTQSRADRHYFVALTASLSGTVTAGSGVGIWYSCKLDAGNGAIAVGNNTNIQDNSTITRVSRDVSIAEDVTIGHNVSLSDCDVGARSLVGMGSVITAGTVIEDNVLVAAGTVTDPGQRLSAGALWAGKPARRISDLDDRKRFMLAETITVYCGYADHFRHTAHSFQDTDKDAEQALGVAAE